MPKNVQPELIILGNEQEIYAELISQHNNRSIYVELLLVSMNNEQVRENFMQIK